MVIPAVLSWLYGQFAAFSHDFMTGFRESRQYQDAFEELPEPPVSPCPLTQCQMADKVAAYAAEHEDFRAMWDVAMCNSVDNVTAQIAGARMAGATSGTVTWKAENVPAPEVLGYGLVRQAFCAAVYAEVTRRLDAMSSPGSFG